MDLTLYQLEDELLQLIQHRVERMADTQDPPKPDELAALDAEINKYHFAEPAKVGRVVAMFRQWRVQRANAKDEIARYRAIVHQLDAMEARMNERVAQVLELLPMPAKGSRKLLGAEGSMLMLKGNGGLEPLQIDGWDSEQEMWLRETVLEPQFIDVTIKLPQSIWALMWDSFAADQLPGNPIVFRTPSNERIRKALALPCSQCGGTGKVVVAKPGDMSAAALDAGALAEAIQCKECGGSGRFRLPGARLLPRGSHVEVK